MTLEEIKAAVTAGKRVCWANRGYVVTGSDTAQWLITFTPNQHSIGLTHLDGVTMNGRPEQFFIDEEPDDLLTQPASLPPEPPPPAKKRVLTHNEWLQANPASSPRGAPMGQYDDDMDPTVKVHVERLDWIDGDYDRSGTYWGRSSKVGDVYAIWQDLDGDRRACYRRAKSRAEAVKLAIEDELVPIRGIKKTEASASTTPKDAP